MTGATHVAFLRAVNVGGRTARKEQLVAAAEAAGAEDVSTYIASGNLLFARGDLPGRRDAIESELEAALETELGFASEVFVRTRAQLRDLAAGNPWAPAVDVESGTYNVGFLRSPLSATASRRLLALGSDADHLATSGREVHWHTVGKMSESVLFERPAIADVIGVPVTMRNIRTVRRLVDRLDG